jgi:hypothetical protein
MKRFIVAIWLLVIYSALSITPTTTEAAAFSISFTEVCYGDRADVTFSWQGANPGSQQFLDLSLQDNGWRDGTFIGFGPLAGNTTTVEWYGLVAGSSHVMRINQLVGGRWDVSQTFKFTPCGTTCSASGAYVTDSSPRQNTTVGIGATLRCGGTPISGASMSAAWHYRTTTSYCNGTSGGNGVASCSRFISGASIGFFVRIDVCFRYQGQDYCDSIGFTPR